MKAENDKFRCKQPHLTDVYSKYHDRTPCPNGSPSRESFVNWIVRKKEIRQAWEI